MIEYLSYNNLDIEKYDACISRSVNSRIYAFSWYLNCVADSWGVLVYKDYEAVMPLPVKSKYGIKYVFLPPWVQQLGIFSENAIPNGLLLDFISGIPKKFKQIEIYLNSENQLSLQNIKTRNNYILKLTTSYDKLIKNFSKGRRSSVKQAEKFKLQIENTTDLSALVNLFHQVKNRRVTRNFDFKRLEKIEEKLHPLEKLKIYHVRNTGKELLGGAVFLFDENRITYLFSVVNEEGKEKQAMSFLINYMINSHANSNCIFDFEGSMIKNLESFFKSFGAEKEIYYHFNQKRIF